MSTKEELAKRVEELEAQLASRPARKLTIKLSDKGCVSLYGVRRFPAAFYRSEWKAIESQIPKINAFIEENLPEIEKREKASRAALEAAKAE